MGREVGEVGMDERTRAQVLSMVETLPSPPALMHRIVKAARAPDVPLRRLASIASTEPTFTMELLRLANSPYYGRSRKVRSVQQATVALGVRAVRNHAVAHVVRVLAARMDLGGFDTRAFWESSLRRAITAMELATTAGFEEPLEAFTVGLIQDVGYLTMAAVWPREAEDLNELLRLPIDARLAAERALVRTTHPELFQVLAERWGFPSDLAAAVYSHHSAEVHLKDRRTYRLSRIALVADAVGDVFQCEGHSKTIDRARMLLERLPSRQPLTLEGVGNAVQEKMPELAKELAIQISRQHSVEALLTEANRSLIQINDDYEELTRQLQKLLAEKEELTRMLERANQELLRLAATDELTGLANRRRFMQVAHTALASAVEHDKPTSVLMLDLDHFKSVNDTYGHAAGDDVLVTVARRLSSKLRTTDLIGRVGGEEFAVVLPETPVDGARAVAERCRESLHAEEVRCRTGVSLRVTASFGGVTSPPGDGEATIDGLLSLADKALYVSKTSGRNKVTWSS